MASITASILIGRSSAKDGIYATHSMYLIEEERPVWFLQETGIGPTELNGACVTWIPRPQSILEDGLLMIAIYIVKSPEIVDLADKYIHSIGTDKADLNNDILGRNLEELRARCRKLKMGKKLVITVMEGSSIGEQLHLLQNYVMPLEVCTTQYSRRPSEQGYEYLAAGTLSSPDKVLHVQH